MNDAGRRIAELSSRQRKALEERVLDARRTAPEASALVSHRGDSGPAALSFSQRRLRFLDRFESGSVAFNIPMVPRLKGPRDVPALEAALGAFSHQRVPTHDRVRRAIADAYRRYEPKPYAGRILYFMNSQRARLPHHKWAELAEEGLDGHVFPGTPNTTFSSPSLEVLAAQVRQCLRAAQESVR